MDVKRQEKSSKMCRRQGKGGPPIAQQRSETLDISCVGSLSGLASKAVRQRESSLATQHPYQ